MKKLKGLLVACLVVPCAILGAVLLTACKKTEHAHAWGEWETVVFATCTAGGWQERVCKDDETHFETRAIAGLGHDWDEYEIVEHANCFDEGKSARICKRDEMHVEIYPIVPRHTWGTWTTVVAATETTDGLEKRVCGRDAEHIETRVQYATGTPGLVFGTANGWINGNYTSYYAVTGYTGTSKNVFIPGGYNYQPVLNIGTSFGWVDGEAFENNKIIENVVISEGIRIIEYGAFRYSSLESISFPDSLTTIKGRAFDGCESLVSVTLGTGLKDVGDHAFNFCNNIANVTIPNGVTDIPAGMFPYCEITSIVIPDTVINIGANAFLNCPINTVTIPVSVKSIGTSAFSGAKAFSVDASNQYFSSLDGVLFNKDQTELLQFPRNNEISDYSIPNGVIRIGEKAFVNSFLNSITISASVTDFEEFFFGGNYNLQAFYVDSSNQHYNSVDGVLFNKSKTTLLQYPAVKAQYSDNSYIIPNGVTTIGSYAFMTIPTISVTIPVSVTSIENPAGITDGFYVDSLNQHYSSLDGVLFNKTQTELLRFPVSKTGDYIIPSGVTTIGASAFANSYLTNVTIHAGVASIGEMAFAGGGQIYVKTHTSKPDGWHPQWNGWMGEDRVEWGVA